MGAIMACLPVIGGTLPVMVAIAHIVHIVITIRDI